MTRFCTTRLNYAGSAGVEVPIYDGRLAGLPGWQACGFELVDHPSAVRDWGDDLEIAEVHYPEIEELARRLTGADRALVSDHVKRLAGPSRTGRTQAPVQLVHSDFAAGYDQIVRTAYREVHGRGAAALRRSGVTSAWIEGAARLVMLQFWRNIGPPRMDYPLAFCDARTVSPAEARPFRYTGYVAGGRSFDALSVLAPEEPSRHTWYTFPDLGVDEVVAFRTYDTELVAQGRTYFLPHTAFPDPRVAEGAPARSSIELRVMCLFA